MDNLEMNRLAPADNVVFDELDELIVGQHDDVLEAIEEEFEDEHDEHIEALEALEALAGIEDLPIEELTEEPEEEVTEAAAEEEEPIIEASTEEDEEPVNVFDDDGTLILDDFSMAELDADLAKQEVYAEQAEASTVKVAEPNSIKAAKKRQTRAPGGGRKRLNRDLESLDKSLFVLSGNPADADEELQANYKRAFIDAMPAQVKVRDKIEQVMHAIANNQAPNRYVEIPLRLLIEKGTVTHSDIVAAYKNAPTKDGSKSLSAGTAAAQTGQIMVLFPYLAMAEKTGKRQITLREDSTVVAKLKAALGI